MTSLLGFLTVFVLLWMHWLASITIHSLVYHRAVTHQSFKFSKLGEKVFMVLAVLVLGPSILSARAYCILHRLHHAYADTDLDPHRPYPGVLGVFKTIYLTSVRYGAIFNGATAIDIDGKVLQIEERFMTNLPLDWPTVDKWFHNGVARFLWVVVYVLFYAMLIDFFDLPSWVYASIFIHATMAPLHGIIVNYGAHVFGDSPNETGDTSRNFTSFWRRFFGLGDDLSHNNHHFRPGVADFSFGEYKSFQVWLLHVLQKKGLVTDVKFA